MASRYYRNLSVSECFFSKSADENHFVADTSKASSRIMSPSLQAHCQPSPVSCASVLLKLVSAEPYVLFCQKETPNLKASAIRSTLIQLLDVSGSKGRLLRPNYLTKSVYSLR